MTAATAGGTRLARVDRLTYSYPGTAGPALDGVAFELEPGLTAVVGRSGSGKSTLLRLHNGLVPHFHGGRVRGAVTVGDHDVLTTSTATLARHVGFVFQDPESQFVRAVVEAEVAFALENTGTPPGLMAARVEEALALTGITHLRDRPLAHLSGGERQRVAIASAIALKPGILVLDEPTSQLDAGGTAEVLAACRDLARAGVAVVVSEHRPGPLLPLADHLAVLDGGRLTGPAAVRTMLPQLSAPPPLIELARRLGWPSEPLTVDEAAPLAPALSRPALPRPARPGPAGWSIDRGAIGHTSRLVLEDVSLSAAAGEVTVLLGPNGGGKTTLLRAISGLQRLLSGSATRAPGRVAYLPQDPGVLLNRRSVLDEVTYTLRRARSAEPPARMLAALGLADLADRYPGDLSSGQRQRAAVAAILAGAPALALLDEPTRGMDADARHRLSVVVRELAAAGSAVVLATHDTDLAAEIADRVVLVADGRAVDAGPPASVFSGAGPYATDIGRLYPGRATTVETVLACL